MDIRLLICFTCIYIVYNDVHVVTVMVHSLSKIHKIVQDILLVRSSQDVASILAKILLGRDGSCL